MVVDDEVEQIYVAGSHRGSGVADALLAEAERQVGAAGHADGPTRVSYESCCQATAEVRFGSALWLGGAPP